MSSPKVTLTDTLHLAIGDAAAQLDPRQAMQLAASLQELAARKGAMQTPPRPYSLEAKGEKFTRVAIALALGRGKLLDSEMIARERWPDQPEIARVVRTVAADGPDPAKWVQRKAAVEADLMQRKAVLAATPESSPEWYQRKTAVEAGSTAAASWAANLAVYSTMMDDWITVLRPLTILGRIPGVVPVPFNTRVAKVTAGIAAQWAGQDNPIPASSMSFGEALVLAPLKLATIVVITRELALVSEPDAEAMIRRDLLAGIAQFADQQFIDPTVTASAGISPASITSGATSRSSTGSSVAQITADAQAMIASAIAGGCTLANAVWVLHPRSAAYLSSVLTAGNQRMWPEVSVRGGTWFGLPVITSASIPTDTGNDVCAVLIDGGEIMLADGGLAVDASGDASLQMSSTPTDAATTTMSLFQANLTGLRAIRYLNYCRRHDAGVQVLADVAW